MTDCGNLSGNNYVDQVVSIEAVRYLQSKIDTQAQKIKALEDMVEAKTKSVTEWHQANANLSKRIGEQVETIHALQENNKRLYAANDDLADKGTEAAAEIVDLKAHIAAAFEKVDELETMNAQQRQTISKMSASVGGQLGATKTTNAKLRAKVADLERSHANQRETILNLGAVQAELDTANNRIADLTAMRDNLSQAYLDLAHQHGLKNEAVLLDLKAIKAQAKAERVLIRRMVAMLEARK